VKALHEKRIMDRLNLKAMDFAKKQEMIKAKMIIYKIRKNMKQERKWL